jgi:hypothetical protein
LRVTSRGLGDVYKRQKIIRLKIIKGIAPGVANSMLKPTFVAPNGECSSVG